MIKSDNKKNYIKALDEINLRRNRAKLENEMHFREIEKNIAEFSVINAQLAQTGKEIIAVVRDGKDVAVRMEKLKQSNLEAQRLIKQLLRDNNYPEDYLEIKYYCNKCDDTGFVGGRRCSCLTDLMASMTIEEMNGASQIKLSDFNTFYLNMYVGRDDEETQSYRKTMSHIFDYCRHYADSFTTNSESIIMFGGTGLGKTHLSLAIAKEVLKKGYTVLYDSVLNYLMTIEKEHFGKADSDADTLENLLETDLLILDDLGTEFDKPIYASTLYMIINTRLNKGLPTIVSTNLNLKQMTEKYNERVLSRIYASYKSLQFVGKDIRILKMQEANKKY